MMRRLLLLAIAMLILVPLTRGQNLTTVTATVVDPNGTVYINGTYSIIFYNPTTRQATYGGIPLQPSQMSYTGQLTASGGLSVKLPSNAFIDPPNTQWTFKICANPAQITMFYPPPTLPCFSSTQTISGSTQVVTFTAAVIPTYGITAGSVIPSLPGDPVQYVSPNGNDSNNGLSWGSAKLTVTAALKALPGGSSTTAGGGTVLLSGTVAADPIGTNGIWLMGANDPNYGSPPAGWLKWGNRPLSIECINKDNSSANSHTPSCTVTGGGTTDSIHPLIWISALAGPLQFKDFEINNYINTPAKIGIPSDNNRSSTLGGSSSITFDGLTWNFGSCRFGGGPGVDIGNNSFWIWFRKINGSGCIFGTLAIAAPGVPGLSRSSNVVTVNTTATNSITAGNNNIVTIQNATDPSFNGSFVVQAINSGTQFTYNQTGPNATSGDGQVVTGNAAAINIDPGTGVGSGLIYVDEFNTNNGGIRLVPGASGGSLSVTRGTFEGDFSSLHGPPVLVTSINTPTNIRVEDLALADISLNVPGVQIDGGQDRPTAVISRVDNGVKGSAILLGDTPLFDPTKSALIQGSYGFANNGRVTAGGIDAARRGFSPVAAVLPNLANTDATTWTYAGGSGTITSGIAAPDGTTGAGRVTSNAGSATLKFYQLLNTPLTLGDTYIYGVWQRSFGNTTLDDYPVFNFGAGGFGTGDVCAPFGSLALPTGNGNVLFKQLSGDGQWIWMSGICKVYTNPTNAGIAFLGHINNPHVEEFYGPVLIKVPVGTKSDNELFEIAANLVSYSPSCVQGEICGLDQTLSMKGYASRGTTFANLGTPANGNLIYCSDCTIANPCAGAGTGAIAKRLAGVWVCN